MRRRSAWFVAAAAVAVALAFVASRYASDLPDGLETVAADTGLDAGEQPHGLADGPFAGYATRGVDDPGLGTGIAGVVGVALAFAVAGGAVMLVSRSSPRRSTTDP